MRHRLLPLVVLATLLAGPVGCQAAQPPAAAAASQAAGLPARGGGDDAKIVILLFSDFDCPDCAGVEPALKEVREEFPKDVQVVFKHNPMPIDPRRRWRTKPAVEAGAAGQVLGDARPAVRANQRKLEAAAARRLRADARSSTSPPSPRRSTRRTHRAAVERDMRRGAALGVDRHTDAVHQGRRGGRRAAGRRR